MIDYDGFVRRCLALQVKEVAKLTGVSVRTLHYYDEINLLTPNKLSSGYRQYEEHHLERLQQILFFKNIGFSLKNIKKIIDDPEFNQLEALQLHKKMLMEKRKQIDKLLENVNKTINHQKGEIQMTQEEKFLGFDFSKNEYEQEARERWGDKAVDASNERINKMAYSEESEFKQQFNQIYRDLANMRKLAPDAKEVQEKIGEWYAMLNKIGTYSYEAFASLGEMYVADERFTKNIDQFGEGLAQFMKEAMEIYAKARM